MPYEFPVPHPRGYQTDSEEKCLKPPQTPEGFFVNDVVLHALLARVTASNGTVHEFHTTYDPHDGSIEVDIPECYLQYLEDNIAVGPQTKRYLRWLIGIASGFVANNLVWVQHDDLVELAPGKRYGTPDAFFEESLAVFIQGLKVEPDNDDGYIVLDDHTFEMRETYDASLRVTCAYLKK